MVFWGFEGPPHPRRAIAVPDGGVGECREPKLVLVLRAALAIPPELLTAISMLAVTVAPFAAQAALRIGLEQA